MAEESKLIATTRELTGSASMRRLRRAGVLPGVVYDEKGKARSIQLDGHGFGMMLRRHASENMIVDLVVDDGKAKKVLLKEIQHDSVSGNILHADFMEISMTKKMRTRIHISLKGDSVGVEMEGGILEHLLRDVEVECLPVDLIEEIEVDISALKVGDSLQVADLVVDPKLVLLTAGDVAIASVSAPRVEEDPVPGEGEEGSEGEEGEAAEGEEGKADGDDKKADGKKEDGNSAKK